jgi:hypothetical protein
MAINVPVANLSRPTSTVIECIWENVPPTLDLFGRTQIPEVSPAFMYFYSGIVSFDYRNTGSDIKGDKVYSFVPLFGAGLPDQAIVVNYVDAGGRPSINSNQITCAASLNTFAALTPIGSDGTARWVLAGVDDATVQLRDFTNQLPGVSGPIHLLVLEATVVAEAASVPRLGYHITVVAAEDFVPRITLPGYFKSNFK